MEDKELARKIVKRIGRIADRLEERVRTKGERRVLEHLWYAAEDLESEFGLEDDDD